VPTALQGRLTPRTKWHIPRAERREIAEKARKRSLRDVAEEHGIDPWTVAYIKREFGIPPNRRGALKIWPGVKYVWVNHGTNWPLHPRNPAPLRWAA